MDTSRVGELYGAHIASARAFAASLTGDWALAEDIAHDCFIRCAGRLSGLRDSDAFLSYLLRAVMRDVQSRGRRAQVERRYLARQRPTMASTVAATEPDDEILTALLALPVRQRSAVAARFLLDWSQAQTAEAMGVSEGTVKSLTSRGLARLREIVPVKGDET